MYRGDDNATWTLAYISAQQNTHSMRTISHSIWSPCFNTQPTQYQYAIRCFLPNLTSTNTQTNCKFCNVKKECFQKQTVQINLQTVLNIRIKCPSASQMICMVDHRNLTFLDTERISTCSVLYLPVHLKLVFWMSANLNILCTSLLQPYCTKRAINLTNYIEFMYKFSSKFTINAACQEKFSIYTVCYNDHGLSFSVCLSAFFISDDQCLRSLNHASFVWLLNIFCI